LLWKVLRWFLHAPVTSSGRRRPTAYPCMPRAPAGAFSRAGACVRMLLRCGCGPRHALRVSHHAPAVLGQRAHPASCSSCLGWTCGSHAPAMRAVEGIARHHMQIPRARPIPTLGPLQQCARGSCRAPTACISACPLLEL
jgi:hypothetical protein